MRRFLSFPNPVNEVAARSVATGVVALIVVALTTGQAWISALIAYGFVARVLCGPRLSPLGRVATQLVAPRLVQYASYVPGPPKRFAQGLGALFSLSATSLWLAGEPTACLVVLGILALPATLEAALGLCIGCELFKIGMRFGVVPESICLECADIYSKSAQQRRLAVTDRVT